MVADEPTDCRQGIDLPDQFQSLFEFPFGNQSHIAFRVLLNGTGLLAGRKRDSFFGGFSLNLSAIESPSKALFFFSIFWNQFSRTPPKADVAGVTPVWLDDRLMGSSFNHGPAFLILFLYGEL
jgi:hypothetical protein